MSGAADLAQQDYRAAVASLIGTVPDAVESEILRRAADMLAPRTYYRARVPVPDEGERYVLAARYIQQEQAALGRPARRDEEPA